MWINETEEILAGAGFGHRKKPVVKADLGVDGLFGTDPVDGAFDLLIAVGLAASGRKVGGATQLDDGTGGILDDLVELDDAGVFQADFAARF